MNPSVAQLEDAGYATWSADELDTIRGWVVRSNSGFTRRVNSATAVGSADTSLEARDAVTQWLAQRNADLAIRVTPRWDSDTLAAVKASWSLDEVDETVVLIRPTRSAEASNVCTVAVDDPVFTRELLDLNDHSDTTLPAWMRLLARMEDGVGLWVPGVAAGVAAIHGGIAMVYSVAVHPSQRRLGWGVAVMDAASAWGASRCATHIGLQVLGTNTAALSLYDSLGYEEVYRYSYFEPPVPNA